MESTTLIGYSVTLNGEADSKREVNCSNKAKASYQKSCVGIFYHRESNIDDIEVLYTNYRQSRREDLLLIRFYNKIKNNKLVYTGPVLLKTDEKVHVLAIRGDIHNDGGFKPMIGGTYLTTHTITGYGNYEPRRDDTWTYRSYRHTRFGLAVNMGQSKDIENISLHLPMALNGIPIEITLSLKNEISIRKEKRRFGIPGT